MDEAFVSHHHIGGNGWAVIVERDDGIFFVAACFHPLCAFRQRRRIQGERLGEALVEYHGDADVLLADQPLELPDGEQKVLRFGPRDGVKAALRRSRFCEP